MNGFVQLGFRFGQPGGQAAQLLYGVSRAGFDGGQRRFVLLFGFGQLGLERGHVGGQRFGGFAGGLQALFQRRDLRVGFVQQAAAFVIIGLQLVVDLLLLLGGGVQLRGGTDHGFVFGLHARDGGVLFFQRGVRSVEGSLRVRQRLFGRGQFLGGFVERVVFLGDGLIQRRDLRVGFVQQAAAFVVIGLQLVVDLLLLPGGGVQLRGGADHGFVFGELGFVFGLHTRGSVELVRQLLLVSRELLNGVVRHADVRFQAGDRGVLFLQRSVRGVEGSLYVRQ